MSGWKAIICTNTKVNTSSFLDNTKDKSNSKIDLYLELGGIPVILFDTVFKPYQFDGIG